VPGGCDPEGLVCAAPGEGVAVAGEGAAAFGRRLGLGRHVRGAPASQPGGGRGLGFGRGGAGPVGEAGARGKKFKRCCGELLWRLSRGWVT